MRIISKDKLEGLREAYKVGTRVRLLQMDDPYVALEHGILGTVEHVDDMGTIHVSWDCGSSLGIVYGVDSCEIVS